LFLKLNPWIMKKERGFVIGLWNMCMKDLLNLSWHISQMRLILISRVMLAHRTIGMGVAKILITLFNFPFTSKVRLMVSD
jgi:sugar phosphate permease